MMKGIAFISVITMVLANYVANYYHKKAQKRMPNDQYLERKKYAKVTNFVATGMALFSIIAI